MEEQDANLGVGPQFHLWLKVTKLLHVSDSSDMDKKGHACFVYLL